MCTFSLNLFVVCVLVFVWCRTGPVMPSSPLAGGAGSNVDDADTVSDSGGGGGGAEDDTSTPVIEAQVGLKLGT